MAEGHITITKAKAIIDELVSKLEVLKHETDGTVHAHVLLSRMIFKEITE